MSIGQLLYLSHWHPAAMRQVDKFCTDDMAQLRYYQQPGYFLDVPFIYAGLSELASGQKAGRETGSERTMTANTGLAIHDMAVASRVYERAVERKIGVWLPL